MILIVVLQVKNLYQSIPGHIGIVMLITAEK